MMWYGREDGLFVGIVGGLELVKQRRDSVKKADDREVVPPRKISDIMWLLFCGSPMKRGRLRELKWLI
jgi:hypothetical protein